MSLTVDVHGLTLAGHEEGTITARVEFDFLPGMEASPWSDCPDPGSPDEVDIIKVEALDEDGNPVPMADWPREWKRDLEEAATIYATSDDNEERRCRRPRSLFWR